jgi:hypothetical protein
MDVTAITVGSIGGRVLNEQTGAPIDAAVSWTPAVEDPRLQCRRVEFRELLPGVHWQLAQMDSRH